MGKLQLALADCVYAINHMITTLALGADFATEYPYPLNQLFDLEAFKELKNTIVRENFSSGIMVFTP